MLYIINVITLSVRSRRRKCSNSGLKEEVVTMFIKKSSNSTKPSHVNTFKYSLEM